MPAYRSDREALEQRAAELREDLSRARREEEELAASHATLEADVAQLEARLREAGRGAGRREAARDRVGFAAMALALVGFPLIFLHAEWHRYVALDYDVLPAILLLGAPGFLAVLVALPYRKHSRVCNAGFMLGAAFALSAIVHASMRWWR